ncbi:MAG: GGDEF domain-containing protein, partial [Pseudomonadota bacterium]
FTIPHVGLMLAITPTYAATTLLVSAWLVWHHRKRPLPAETGATIALALFGAVQLATAITALMSGPERVDWVVAAYHQINFLALPAAYTAVGLFAVFMLASDLAEVMKEAAVRDQLTGLLNRRGFGEAGAKAYATARRYDRPVSVIMTDIDHFKAINDSFGHIVGDEALVHFALVLTSGRRGEDLVARVGGEEFAIILPGADIEESLGIASRLCDALSSTPMILGDGVVEMTASFGVATLSNSDTCLSDAIVRADAALYQSKEKGRNRVDLESSAATLLPDGHLLHRIRGAADAN